MKQRTISLTVKDPYGRDQGRTVARIDFDTMDFLDASFGDVLEIRAGSESKEQNVTVAKCVPLYPSDEGKGIVRFDHLVGKNAGGVGFGDTVVIKRIEAPRATKIIVKQVEPILPVPEQYEPINGKWIVECLETMPIMQGDTVMVPYFTGRTWFKINDVEPAEVAVICKDTVCELTTAK